MLELVFVEEEPYDKKKLDMKASTYPKFTGLYLC